MKSCALTGSISRRRRSMRVRGGCARAAAARRTPRRRRSAREAAAQREALRLRGARAAISTSDGVERGARRELGDGRRGRTRERWPRTARDARRPLRSAAAAPRAPRAARRRARARRPGTAPRRRAATRSRASARRAASSTRAARPSATSASNHASHAGSGSRHHEREQRVVQLLGVARRRARLLAHARDRLGVEAAELARVLGQAAAERHRARAALLERRVVEERVRLAVQDLVRERRSARSCRGGARAPRRSPSPRAARRGRRRRSPRAGSRASSGARAGGRGARSGRSRSPGTAASAGKTAAIRSSASMRWIGGGTRRPPRCRSSTSERPAFQRQRTAEAPARAAAPARASRAPCPASRKRGTASSGKLCCGAEREHDRVVARRGLQLEVEACGRSACAARARARG